MPQEIVNNNRSGTSQKNQSVNKIVNRPTEKKIMNRVLLCGAVLKQIFN